MKPPDLSIALSAVQEEMGVSAGELGEYLGVNRTTIVKFRAGLEELPVHAKWAIYEHLGHLDGLQWVQGVLPAKAVPKITEWRKRHANWVRRNQS